TFTARNLTLAAAILLVATDTHEVVMRPILRALFGLLLANAVQAEPATPPDTTAGHALAAWLEAVNSGDRAKVVAYDTAYAQTEKNPERLLELHESTGGFTLVRIEKSEPLTVTALLQEQASDTMLRFSLSVTDGTPT